MLEGSLLLIKVSVPLPILYSFFSCTFYSRIHVCWYTCMCLCVSVYMCTWKCVLHRNSVLLWLQEFKVAFFQAALSYRRLDVIDVGWTKLTDLLFFNILVYNPYTHTHKEAKKMLFITIFFLSLILTDKLINVHIKLNHYALLNTFLWYLLNDHLSPLLSE